jgi:hypothetical protein
VNKPSDVRSEWIALADGYPGEDEATRAAFDVLAPVGWAGRRWPVQEHSTGPPKVDEVWAFAERIAEAVRRIRAS